jgi:hypothetical protein
VCRHVDEIIRRQPVIDRHDDRPELRYGVELLELLMRVGCDCRNPVAFGDAQLRERGAPAVTPLAELGIREANIAVDHGLAPAMQFACAAREFERCQRRFQRLAFATWPDQWLTIIRAY